MDRKFIGNTIIEKAVEAFFFNTPDMVFIKDERLNYVYASKAFCLNVGLNESENIVGKTDFDFFDKTLAERYREDDMRLLTTGKAQVDFIEPLPFTDGKRHYSSTSKYVIYDENARVIGLYGVGRDITQQLEMEEGRERSNLNYGLLYDSMLEADISENRVIRALGGGWEELFGLPKEISYSSAVKKLSETLYSQEDAEDFLSRYDTQKLIEGYKNGTEEFSHISRQKNSDECCGYTKYTTRLFSSKISHTLKIVIYAHNKDEEIKTTQELRIKASTDQLTGLYNRKAAIDKISDCIEKKESFEKHALLFVDLDCFKNVNDTLGHPAGDRLLKIVADKIREVFRSSDIAGRVGGDEFLILMKNISDKEDIRSKTQRLLDSVAAASGEEDKAQTTLSVGIALYEGDGVKFSVLYERADKAMYRAKNKGKNRIEFY